MNNEEYIIKQYYFELKRKQDALDSLRVYIPSIALILGFISFFANWVISSGGAFDWIVFILDLLFSFLLIGILLSATIGKPYEAVPTPKKILEHKNKLIQHYKSIDSDVTESEIDTEIKEKLIAAYAESTHVNTINNDYKYRKYDWANKCILAIAFLFIVSSISYLTQVKRDNGQNEIKIIGIEKILNIVNDAVKKPIKIEIVNPVITHPQKIEKEGCEKNVLDKVEK